MRCLVGTPCAGGQVTSHYLMSYIETIGGVTRHRQDLTNAILEQNPGFDKKDPNQVQSLQMTLQKHGYDLGLYTLGGESLLQRGRNHIAWAALSGGWDKLMFIDADAQWTWPQLKKILDSPHPITAGVCPLKVYPISLNFLPFAEDEIHFHRAQRSVEGMRKMAAAHGSNYVKVPFVGTAFLCIDTKVLMAMAEVCDHYLYPDPTTGQVMSHWDFFQVKSINNSYLSEDWSACATARKLGFDVHLDCDVIIGHIGNHHFKAV